MKKAVIIIICILIGVCVFEMIYPRFAHKLEYKSATTTIYVEYKEVTDYTKEEVKNKLENILGVNSYFYVEKDLDEDISGFTYLMFRLIVIEKDLSINDYIEVLCHEMIHLKYNTIDERFTQYKTFERLFESEFRQVALNIVHDMQWGVYPYEYECYAYIVDYLKQVQFI
jgi:hypothetical protein